MGSKRVVHILNELNYSGAEKMLMLAAHYLKEKDFELNILTTGIQIGNYSDILRNAGYNIMHIPWGGNPLLVFYNVYKYLKKEKYDVVHIHREHAFFWLILVSKLAGVKKVVRTVHNVFIFSGFLRIIRLIQRQFSVKLFGAKFISIGASVYEVELKYFLNKTIIVPNWIDQKKFMPAQDTYEKEKLRELLKITKESFVIISIGACTEVKNHKDILLAVEMIKEKNIIYMHLGDGPLNENEKQMACDLSIEDNTRFCGQIENVRDVLIASDLILMPSQFEGLPISLLEALSCGIPALVYNAYGIKDLVKDQENGLVVDSNPKAIAEAITYLQNDPKKMENMSRKAIQKIIEEYDMHKSIDKMISIY